MKGKEEIYAFDFDGTLTNKDSFVSICIFAAGKLRFSACILQFLPRLIFMKLGLCSASKTKEMIFSHFFKGMNIDDFSNICSQFTQTCKNFIKQDGLEAVKNACSKGKCLIVSASAKNWISLFFAPLPIEYITTELEIDKNNILTGKFSTPNCKGIEKVNRIKTLFPNRNDYTLISYGDSKDDKEMLAFSDKSFYRVFRGNRKTSAQLIAELFRFCITGVIAVLIQYTSYRFLLKIFAPIAANAISYAISMSFNFVLSSLFTFRVKLSKKKLAGFLFSHAINFFLQTLFLSIFISIGIQKQFAPIPVYALCVPINFILVRFFLKR